MMSKKLAHKPNGKRFYKKAPVTVQVQEVATETQGRVTAITLKFPSFPRIITAPLTFVRVFDMWIIVGFTTGIILMGIIISGIRLNQNLTELTRMKNMRSDILRQYAYWEEVMKTKKDYRDGYYALSALAYQLGEMEEARTYLKKVFTLDPKFRGAEVLSEKLGS